MMKFNFNIVFVAFVLISFSIVSTKSQSTDCNAFIDNLGVFNQPQSCSMLGKFCCGSCSTVRFCCDDPLYALNQTSCPHSPSQNAKTSTSRQNTVSYQYIITVDNTIYWIKICVIVVPLFIFVVLLSIVFVLCAKARKARRREAQLIYSFDPQLGRLPRSIAGAQIYTIPITLNEAPKYESLKKSALPNGAIIIQPEELPKYDDLKRF